MRLPTERRVPRVLGVLALLAGSAAAQGREVQFFVGRWAVGGGATVYELRSTTPIGRSFAHGLSATALVHDNLGRNRAYYGLGYGLILLRGRGTVAPYLAASAAVGLSTDTTKQALGALWALGAGADWRLLPWLSLAAEARYRIVDRGPRGFWRMKDTYEAMSLSVGVGLAFGAARSAARPSTPTPPSEPFLSSITGNASDVVRTALDALGSPYQWGGTAENGFDCSGLIQYSYAQHGLRVPRTSRDQARAGSAVEPVVEALVPGDILLFAASPGGGVTHVGMYVGEGRFVHSATQGVRLSRLDPSDPEAVWWLPRWVGARRVVPAP